MSEMVNIEGLDRADVLRVLYNRSRPLGMGWAHFTPDDMSEGEAAKLVAEQEYFDYLHGRVMKIRLEQGATEISCFAYDRDNGAGAASDAIQHLRATLAVEGK